MALSAAAGARHVLHHGPSRTDDEIDALLRQVRPGGPRGLSVDAAAEGMEFDLRAVAPGGPRA